MINYASNLDYTTVLWNSTLESADCSLFGYTGKVGSMKGEMELKDSIVASGEESDEGEGEGEITTSRKRQRSLRATTVTNSNNSKIEDEKSHKRGGRRDSKKTKVNQEDGNDDEDEEEGKKKQKHEKDDKQNSGERLLTMGEQLAAMTNEARKKKEEEYKEDVDEDEENEEEEDNGMEIDNETDEEGEEEEVDEDNNKDDEEEEDEEAEFQTEMKQNGKKVSKNKISKTNNEESTTSTDATDPTDKSENHLIYTPSSSPSSSSFPSFRVQDNLSNALAQAIKATDESMMEQCLLCKDETTISRTIQYLPTPLASFFLRQLIVRIDLRPNRADELLIWIKYILLYHASALSNNEKWLMDLQTLESLTAKRSANYQRLLGLSGRLEMLLAQVDRVGASTKKGVDGRGSQRRGGAGPSTSTIVFQDDDDSDEEDNLGSRTLLLRYN